MAKNGLKIATSHQAKCSSSQCQHIFPTWLTCPAQLTCDVTLSQQHSSPGATTVTPQQKVVSQ